MQFPDHGIIAEESGMELVESDYCWFIDPLDGNTNFVHGYPSFGISIGLFYQNKPQVGVVIEMPAMNLYTAKRVMVFFAIISHPCFHDQ
ncbi:MAG: hypothetical protein Ct9H300mP2_5280 [Candidatus Neomarinimicrobiota bacterium]|nr:MAG: hypothetical protein Ct9H300mP2_5280 [Candidatus Neomarinimicrobiota bacterium]